MDDLTGYLVAIGAILVCLGFTLLALMIYSGLFENVTVGAGSPPIGEAYIAYRFQRGPYKEVGQIFTELAIIAPDNRCVGIYYDDPKRVPAHLTRYMVGSILSTNHDHPDPQMKKKFEENGYKFFRIPEVANVVKTSFPHISSLSIFIAIYKVYPLMGSYVQDHKLCAHPYLEIYDGKTIHFMAPLAQQEEFYVPEMKREGPEGAVIVEADENNPVYTEVSTTATFTTAETESNEADAVTPGNQDGGVTPSNQDGGESESSTGSSFEELKLEGEDHCRKADSPDSTTQ